MKIFLQHLREKLEKIKKRYRGYSPRKKRTIKALSITLSVLLVLAVLTYSFRLSILNLVAGMMLRNNPPVETVEGVGYLFEGCDQYVEHPQMLNNETLTPLNADMSLFRDNKTTDLATAIHLFRIAEGNLSKIHSFGVYQEIDGSHFELKTGDVVAVGKIVSQIVKVQRGDAFFMNEAFVLKEVAFESKQDTSLLEELLVNMVNGGNRIYMDADSREKWIQFAPMGAAKWNEEKKLVTLDLEVATLGYIKDKADYPSEEVYYKDEMHSGYHKEYEFSKLLLVDFSESTLTGAATEYLPREHMYKIVYDINVAGLSASPKAGGAIARLLGTDGSGNPNVDELKFDKAAFEVEIWENGLIKSVRGIFDWSGSAKVGLTLSARAENTKIQFSFTYDRNDCSDQTLRERYYSGEIQIKEKCSLIDKYPDAPVKKECRHCKDED